MGGPEHLASARFPPHQDRYENTRCPVYCAASPPIPMNGGGRLMRTNPVSSSAGENTLSVCLGAGPLVAPFAPLGPNPDPTSESRRRRSAMRRVEVRNRRRLLDDFFKVDEAEVSFERFDGSMTPPVRRLVFERGDSVAAVVFDRDAKRLLLTEQFCFPMFDMGSGWLHKF